MSSRGFRRAAGARDPRGPENRRATLDDVGACAAFLADAAKAITGKHSYVDAGVQHAFDRESHLSRDADQRDRLLHFAAKEAHPVCIAAQA